MSPINFVGRWFVIVLIVGVSACGGGGGDSPPQLAAPSNVSSADEVPVTLLLQSDIETDSTTFYDTTHDLWNSPAGPVPIQYEDGGYSARQLQVIDDPTETGNKVLDFKLVNPDSAGTKQRIQTISSGLSFNGVKMSGRLYLHPDLRYITDLAGDGSGLNFIILSEYWHGEDWVPNVPYPFRSSLRLYKDAGVGSPLYFIATGIKGHSGLLTTVWAYGSTYRPPLGRWLDIELTNITGDNTSGRFVLKVNGETVLDITDWTYSPDSPTPVPLSTWHALKFYAGQNVIDYVRNNSPSGAMHIYWDDVKLQRIR